MSKQANFSIKGRNPDVLTCIANLSNDEVFTPPEFANQMLDTLAESWAKSNNGENIWANPDLKFLDPFTKSGVFLREIVSRLTAGLEDKIPDLQKRVDHIVTKQVFGIGVTELTSLLARRSVYCSKYANGEHSIGKSFANEQGNIWFERTEHTWVGGSKGLLLGEDDKGEPLYEKIGAKCKYCGAPNKLFDRDKDLDTHAYALIHTDNVMLTLNSIFGDEMQFDVVIGNPPYQMTDAAGGGVDSSIYHLFVNIAKQLEPRLLSMVIPSRWMGGATRGVGDFNGFRDGMLQDGHLRVLADYPNSKEVFPGVDIKGGVCYFVWDRSYSGTTQVTIFRDGTSKTSNRQLDEHDVFVREEMAVQILRKVESHNESSIIEILTADTPFGISSNSTLHTATKAPGDIDLYLSRNGKREVGFIKREAIKKNTNLIDKWKLLTPGAGSDGGQKIPDIVLGKPWLSPPPSACTQTFLAFYIDSEVEAKNLETYFRSKFFRFLVSLRKITQNGFRSTYSFVPMQDLNKPWNDTELYKKYELTEEEQDYIESVIRPMELGGIE